ncbi:Hypothetical predicted protein [Octopus vulgaris]|uniref:Uncharacterized protein n=1 Tax=Octopus vulgaris TaxID=6645 RepID=A0AA36FEL3_OCTVU|nr:Hypothetical predicted protein [Octopus vulgaris]
MAVLSEQVRSDQVISASTGQMTIVDTEKVSSVNIEQVCSVEAGQVTSVTSEQACSGKTKRVSSVNIVLSLLDQCINVVNIVANNASSPRDKRSKVRLTSTSHSSIRENFGKDNGNN